MKKNKKPSKNIIFGVYSGIVKEIILQIRSRRYNAAVSANREHLLLYFTAGKILSEKVKAADWGQKVLSIICEGIQKEFPGIRGFSIRNLKNMRRFYEAYTSVEISRSAIAESAEKQIGQPTTARVAKFQFGQLSTAQINDVFLKIGFTHHILLLQKCPDHKERFFYMHQAVINQWSVNTLGYHIESGLYKRKGKISSNFKLTLPEKLKSHALETFKDEYLLNFINVTDGDSEEVIENELVKNLRDFLMSLGREFAFMGNQYRVVVDEEEFFVDLLFYHRQLQALIAFELKAGKFKPEYAGKMNFYLEALDNYVKLEHENPSIGIILCREKKNTIVEFAFKRVDRPMGVATYVLSKKLPPEYKNFLPTATQIKKAVLKGIKD